MTEATVTDVEFDMISEGKQRFVLLDESVVIGEEILIRETHPSRDEGSTGYYTGREVRKVVGWTVSQTWKPCGHSVVVAAWEVSE